jgi:hypothetical protein
MDQAHLESFIIVGILAWIVTLIALITSIVDRWNLCSIVGIMYGLVLQTFGLVLLFKAKRKWKDGTDSKRERDL